MLARTILLLDEKHRTGYRRCLLQFLKDLLVLPVSQQNLLLQNFNSLCAVDIERVHGMLASVIPTVHKKQSTEQEARTHMYILCTIVHTLHTHVWTLTYARTHGPTQTIDDACQNFQILKSSVQSNRSYHDDAQPDDAKTSGYSLPDMPVKSSLWISTASNIVRAQFLRCMEATNAPQFNNGDVYNVNVKKPPNGTHTHMHGHMHAHMYPYALAHRYRD